MGVCAERPVDEKAGVGGEGWSPPGRGVLVPPGYHTQRKPAVICRAQCLRG